MRALAATISFVIGMIIVQAKAETESLYRITCPTRVGNSRIVAIKIDISAGRVTSISALPPGWSLIINNDPSVHSTVRGSASVGSAALDCAKIRNITLQVSKEVFGDLQFNLAGSITATSDFIKEQTIQLDSHNFEITK